MFTIPHKLEQMLLVFASLHPSGVPIICILFRTKLIVVGSDWPSETSCDRQILSSALTPTLKVEAGE